ncbi:hypothetical protein Tsubulata_051071 [Turnera subulata]|uniref:Uncharacterized protein n=1 Tax=Turnera subulata TaxID=218843 RepID=A0A9Q0JAR5_9ROSI|nr:hypothetical protein Tsubulata_051071 [Turnera subulata]
MRRARVGVENKVQSIVDVRDAAEAPILAYETPAADGRYICTSHSISSEDLDKEGARESSEKLQKLGWSSSPLEWRILSSILWKAMG